MNRTSIAALIACCLLAPSCAPMPPPAPGSTLYSGAGETAYRRGYHAGFQDGKRGRDSDYESYHDEYVDATEDAFEKGYDLGYETGEDQSDADDDERERVEKAGHEAGRTDAENGLSPFYQRHRRDFTPATEPEFRRGYVKSYNAEREDGALTGERRAYGDGYRQGELDIERRHPARPDARPAGLSAIDEDAYIQGYNDGYRHREPKY